MLLNFGRNIMFSGAPGFPLLAAMKVGYEFLQSGRTQEVSKLSRHSSLAPSQKPTNLTKLTTVIRRRIELVT